MPQKYKPQNCHFPKPQNLKTSKIATCTVLDTSYVTQFAKTRHNDAFLEIQIFASVSSIYLKLCSVVISMLYCKYLSSYKAR